MIHLPFLTRSATHSQSNSSTETALSFTARRAKRVNYLLGLLVVGWTSLLIGCKSSETVSTLGDWSPKSQLEGPARYAATSFVVSNIAYMGTGSDASNNRLNDFWAYDPARNAWTQKANFGGVARNVAVGFAVGTKGYIGTGVNANNDRLKDFWEYDPTANTWKRVADFGGTARERATAFAIGNNGYVGTGFDSNYLKDMWAYAPATNTWTKVASYGGNKRVGAVAFVINNKAYMGTGNNNGTPQSDWYMYSPGEDLWTQKADFTTDQVGIARSWAVGFAIGSKGYITTGSASAKDVWEYDPATDLWTTRGTFEGSPRNYAVGFAIGNKGYITTGLNGSSSAYDDLWDFDPTIPQVIP